MNHFNFALNGKLLQKVCNNKLNFYRAKLNSSLQFKFITIFIIVSQLGRKELIIAMFQLPGLNQDERESCLC